MFATVRVSSQEASEVLAIPESAIQHDRDRVFVFVQKEPGVYESRTVKLGEKNGAFAEVLEGVQEGETVVKEGAFTLKSELLKPKD
jgi:multidrug efflux pump subunit AcrA (membrane-fusion protein)